MSDQQLKVKIRGIYTDPNNFSEVPEGALARAENVVIDKDSVIESRRGQNFYGTQLLANIPVDKLMNYQGKLIAHYSDKLSYDSDDNGTWIEYTGSYSQPDSAFRIQSIQANRNLYFTTSTGVKKLDSISATPMETGAVKALGGMASTTGSSGFMSNSTQVAYRVIWGYKDLNGNLILGAPSQRIIAVNSSGSTRDVSITFQIPSGVTPHWFYQVYRSPESVSSSSEPTDELQLVYEDNPSSGEVSAGFITVTDSVPDSLKGATLYTSPSQEGIAASNEQPPFCKDITVYKGYTLFANTRGKQRLTITLVSVDGTEGLVAGSTLTINGVTYTGVTTTPSNNEFIVATSGTPAENIADTASNLVNCINSSSTNTDVYAYYLSGYSELPGKILIEERGIGGSPYSAISNKGTAFNPTLPVTGSDVSSSTDEAANRVYFSKYQQPEAVPLLNYIDFGSKNSPIRRIIALRDSTFILKDDGVFRLIGEDPSSFRATLFDSTAVIRAPEAAVAFNSQIMMFSEQGVTSISDAGVSVLSRPIESTLLKLTNTVEYPNFETATFAVSYESDRKYILFTVTSKNDVVATQAFVFNSFTNSWTRWPMGRTSALVNSRDNKLYLGTGSGYVYKERKSFTLSDYADESYLLTIVSASENQVTVDSASNVKVGMSLGQGSSSALILSISDNVLTLDRVQSWAESSAEVYTPITNTVQWLPLDIGNPGVLKHFQDVTLFFRDASFRNVELEMTSNFSPVRETIQLFPVRGDAWGSFPWGDIAWGGGLGGQQTLRTYVLQEKARASWINLSIVNKQAFTSMSLTGLSLIYKPMSQKFF